MKLTIINKIYVLITFIFLYKGINPFIYLPVKFAAITAILIALNLYRLDRKTNW